MPTLNWIGKEAVVNHHQQVPFRLLKDVPDLACGDLGSGNLIVRGDNLEALKALLPYYAGQVKCIYIDPPYNTGNEGWAYNDNVNSPVMRDWLGKIVGKEGETLDRHDRWLCMMYPRLALLKRFFSPDGSIWISIDDNEVAHLRLVMEEVFGSNNFVATMAWQRRISPDARLGLSQAHDHIIVFAKKSDSTAFNKIPVSAWSWLPHTESGHNQEAKQEINSILCQDTPFDTPKPTRLLERIFQIATNPGDLVLDSFAGSGTTAHAVLKMNAAVVVDAASPPRSQVAAASPPHESCGGDAAATGRETCGGDAAATDAAATARLQRRFILVEMEPKIARKVTAERVRRVAQDYTNAKGEAVEGLGGGFRFCELGEPLFDETGMIRETVKFSELARHVYFSETGEPLPRARVLNTPFLGACRGVGIYLLYNGILGDESASGGNVLTRQILAKLPEFDVPKVVYCAGCLLSRDRLQSARITVRQTPYEIKVS
ncbi:MAG: site-specific DNA-methyltransferase [Kiritimatiellae bacterium]|nr:site-specific DNA-methyltransferase [Kiritimatiellia bacterium]